MNLQDLKGKGLLIHHWDADGICSARLLLNALNGKTIVNTTPHLGNYYLTPEELEEYKHYDFIIIADMALPEDNIKILSEHAQILIFDHHLQPENTTVFHHNPVIKGENPDEYPSASWIVNDFLGEQINLFALLGVIGDHEKRIRNNPYIYPAIEQYCEDHHLSFDDLLHMVYLLDSNYKLGERHAVIQAPRYLLEHGGPQDILKHKQWQANLTTLNQEINRQLLQPDDEINDLIIKIIHTPYNIISTITRKVAWESGKNALVINTGYFDDKDQVYMRSHKTAEPMIKRGKDLGFKCGGKKEVLGAIVPKEKTDSFVDELKSYVLQKGG